ncbi:MAG TPA: hypothetical protein VFM90_11655, partial [Cyclobacteriaceae bacterium]|nr:hypothetical protein [Cyclobacteriaceae bacterium]
EDKAAFEQQVQADPRLAQELDLQQNVVGGIRQARAAELKQMLNNVPLSTIPGGNSVLVKVGMWAVITGLVVTGIYFYSSEEDKTPAEPEVITEQNSIAQPEVTETPEAAPEPAPTREEPAAVTKADEKVTKAERKPAAKEPAPVKPLDVYEPSEEETDPQTQEYEHEQMENIKKAFVTSSIEVETDTMSKKYNFHYVFKNNKLILYGAFEDNLYEILEFIGDEKRTVALFYKSNYYLLDIEKTQPTRLTPIHDKNLLKILKTHRGK